MAERELIREYLVSLGFQVEETDLKKFVSVMASTCKTAGKLGASLVGVAVAAEAMVLRFAHSMEKLYYVSKRTRSTVGEIQALEFGAEQVGVAGDAARAALEGMSQALRVNPGVRALLNTLLGRDTGGEQTTKSMIDLVKRLSKMPHFIGSQYAEMFGMDEQMFTMLKLHLPELEAAQERRRQMNREAGIDADEAAKASRAYMNDLREIWEMLGVLKDRVAINLLVPFREFAGVVKEVVGDLSRIDTIDFSHLGGFIDEQLRKWGKWGEIMGDIIKRLQFTPGQLARDIYWRTLGTPGLDNEDPEGIKQRSAAGRIRSGGVIDPNLLPKNGPQGLGTRSVTGGIRGGAPLPLGLSQNNPGNLRSWGSAEVRNGFAAFRTMQEGLSAMAGNLTSYAKQGRVTVEDIISRWAPPGDKNDTAAYIANVARQLRVGANDTLAMTDPQQLARLMDVMIKQEQGYNPIGTAELVAAARERTERAGGAAPGAGSVVLQQENNITVNGAGDAQRTGDAVGLQLRYVNSDLLRNLQGAVR